MSSWNDDNNSRCNMNDIWGHSKGDTQAKEEETGERSEVKNCKRFERQLRKVKRFDKWAADKRIMSRRSSRKIGLFESEHCDCELQGQRVGV